jgi:hypothetical protein
MLAVLAMRISGSFGHRLRTKVLAVGKLTIKAQWRDAKALLPMGLPLGIVSGCNLQGIG